MSHFRLYSDLENVARFLFEHKKKKRIKLFDVSMYPKNEKMLTVKGVKRVEI